jgi:hypothetical protein
MAGIIEKIGFTRAMEKFSPSGVWLWQNYKGELWVHKKWGSLVYCPDLCCWASESPDDAIPSDGWYDVVDGDYKPGEIPARKPVLDYRSKWWLEDERFAGRLGY